MSVRAGLLALLLASTAASGSARDPHVSYMLECQGCHGADGAGTASVPRLADQVADFLRVPGGREYLIRVPGSAQSSLSDAELARVLTWMVRTFGPADAASDFAPFSAQEVAQQRTPLVDVEPVRRDLLRRIAAARAAQPGP